MTPSQATPAPQRQSETVEGSWVHVPQQTAVHHQPAFETGATRFSATPSDPPGPKQASTLSVSARLQANFQRVAEERLRRRNDRLRQASEQRLHALGQPRGYDTAVHAIDSRQSPMVSETYFPSISAAAATTGPSTANSAPQPSRGEVLRARLDAIIQRRREARSSAPGNTFSTATAPSNAVPTPPRFNPARIALSRVLRPALKKVRNPRRLGLNVHWTPSLVSGTRIVSRWQSQSPYLYLDPADLTLMPEDDESDSDEDCQSFDVPTAATNAPDTVPSVEINTEGARVEVEMESDLLNHKAQDEPQIARDTTADIFLHMYEDERQSVKHTALVEPHIAPDASSTTSDLFIHMYEDERQTVNNTAQDEPRIAQHMASDEPQVAEDMTPTSSTSTDLFLNMYEVEPQMVNNTVYDAPQVDVNTVHDAPQVVVNNTAQDEPQIDQEPELEEQRASVGGEVSPASSSGLRSSSPVTDPERCLDGTRHPGQDIPAIALNPAPVEEIAAPTSSVATDSLEFSELSRSQLMAMAIGRAPEPAASNDTPAAPVSSVATDSLEFSELSRSQLMAMAFSRAPEPAASTNAPAAPTDAPAATPEEPSQEPDWAVSGSAFPRLSRQALLDKAFGRTPVVAASTEAPAPPSYAPATPTDAPATAAVEKPGLESDWTVSDHFPRLSRQALLDKAFGRTPVAAASPEAPAPSAPSTDAPAAAAVEEPIPESDWTVSDSDFTRLSRRALLDKAFGRTRHPCPEVASLPQEPQPQPQPQGPDRPDLMSQPDKIEGFVRDARAQVLQRRVQKQELRWQKDALERQRALSPDNLPTITESDDLSRSHMASDTAAPEQAADRPQPACDQEPPTANSLLSARKPSSIPSAPSAKSSSQRSTRFSRCKAQLMALKQGVKEATTTTTTPQAAQPPVAEQSEAIAEVDSLASLEADLARLNAIRAKQDAIIARVKAELRGGAPAVLAPIGMPDPPPRRTIRLKAIKPRPKMRTVVIKLDRNGKLVNPPWKNTPQPASSSGAAPGDFNRSIWWEEACRAGYFPINPPWSRGAEEMKAKRAIQQKYPGPIRLGFVARTTPAAAPPPMQQWSPAHDVPEETGRRSWSWKGVAAVAAAATVAIGAGIWLLC